MTAELAVALPAVVLSAAAVVAVGQAAVAQVSCVDAARAGARAAARGDSGPRVQQVTQQAAGSTGVAVDVGRSGAQVTVAVHRRVHLVLPDGPTITVRARASAESEPEVGGAAERGSATVLAAALVALAAVLAVLVAGLASAVVARHRAASAADLAALAAASALSGSLDGPCATAEVVAERNGARVSRCSVVATSVDVSVEVRPAGVAGHLGDAVGRARAGPGLPGPAGVQRQGWR